MKIAAIVPSAGSGKRMRSRTDKPFIRLCGKEIICYALSVLENSRLISEIIVAAKKRNIPRLKDIIRREGFAKIRCVTPGGRQRSVSVFNALSKVSPDADYILIHDAARPFISRGLINGTVNAAKRYGASLSAVRISPTVKEADAKGSMVKRTLDRGFLWEAHTPQVVKKDILLSAYKTLGEARGYFTDEASLIEKTGRPVKIVKGSCSNIKITTPEDLVVAEALMRRKNRKVES